MDVQNLKWWHWVIVGVVAGGLLSWVKLSTAPGEGAAARRSVSVDTFLANVGRSQGNLPVLREVLVHPPRDLWGERVYYVTFQMLDRAVGQKRYLRSSMYAPAAFPMSRDDLAPTAGFSVRDFLAKKNVPHRYAWWATRPATIAMWLGGSVLLIGGVWPLALNLLVGAGFGRKRDEPAYDLDRFGQGAAAAVAADEPADVDRLREIEEEIEANVTAPAPVTPPAPAAKVALSSEPIQEAPPPAPERVHHYRGQYYPVDLPEGQEKS